jgi:prolyl-tRNA synthetase
VTNLVEDVKVLLDEIQKNLFKTAQERRDACVQVVNSWDEFTTALNNKRLILAPWCDEEVLDVVLFVTRFASSEFVLNLGNN